VRWRGSRPRPARTCSSTSWGAGRGSRRSSRSFESRERGSRKKKLHAADFGALRVREHRI
jgi:hypothetical protein